MRGRANLGALTTADLVTSAFQVDTAALARTMREAFRVDVASLAAEFGGIASIDVAKVARIDVGLVKQSAAALESLGEARSLRESLALDFATLESVKREVARFKMDPARLASVGMLDEHAVGQLLRSPLAAKGFLSPGHTLDTSALITRIAAGLAPLAEQADLLRRAAGSVELDPEIDAAVDRVAKRWEDNPLWFLLCELAVDQFAGLEQLERAEVEDLLLDALEAVITEGTFTRTLARVVETAPSLDADQRDDLLHGLEHAELGEFVRAARPLIGGLEGAFWNVGREYEVIDGDRRLLDRPEKGRIHSVEVVVRKLPAAQEFRTFICGRLLGNVGNPLRHGESSDRRRQTLFGVVGVAGWVDNFTDARATPALWRMLSDEIASAGGAGPFRTALPPSAAA